MSYLGGYTPNYFSIDDILATQERAACKFLTKVPKLGQQLNPSGEAEDVEPGVSLELPVWLIQKMVTGRQPLVSAELPKFYSEIYREILLADPNAGDLRKFGIYFYELGSYAKQFDNKAEVGEVLIYTFKERFRKIMDLANNSCLDPSVLDHLDGIERKIYGEAHKARSKLNMWLTEHGIALQAADMVINHKKRKRVDVDDILS